MIKGNIQGIKQSTIEALESLYDINIEKDNVFSLELIEVMNEITRKIGKEISVAINRKGTITEVVVGDSKSVKLPYIDVKDKRLSGFRIIHTHPSGNSKLSTLDISALMSLKLDAMVAVGVNEDIRKVKVNVAYCDVINNSLAYEEKERLSLESAMTLSLMDKVNHITSIMKQIKRNNDIERAILVGIDSEESLDELEGLAHACEAVVIEKVFQKRRKISPSLYIGEGKVQEISYLRQATNANLIIFDDELSASQVRNIQSRVGCKVIDRTILILDIFARRARSNEASLQVELAMLKHMLPRLRGAGADLDKIKGGVSLKGGIGSRGPGEKKLESDRRHIERRIEEIKSDLERIIQTRVVQREKRVQSNISRVALVGYTNAGKSTLRNKICEVAAANSIEKEGVFEADMLFATLDTTIRAVALADNRKIALSDTVGFIRKLPHELVEAFKSTLEETLEADILLHVIDASNDEALEQIEAVSNVLTELSALDKKIVMVLNKIDKATEEQRILLREELKGEEIIEVSASSGDNIEKLLELIGDIIPVKLTEKVFMIPYTDQGVVSMLHDTSNIISQEHGEEGTTIRAMVDDIMYSKCSRFVV